jgi:hypothetical protein
LPVLLLLLLLRRALILLLAVSALSLLLERRLVEVSLDLCERGPVVLVPRATRHRVRLTGSLQRRERWLSLVVSTSSTSAAVKLLEIAASSPATPSSAALEVSSSARVVCVRFVLDGDHLLLIAPVVVVGSRIAPSSRGRIISISTSPPAPTTAYCSSSVEIIHHRHSSRIRLGADRSSDDAHWMRRLEVVIALQVLLWRELLLKSGLMEGTSLLQPTINVVLLLAVVTIVIIVILTEPAATTAPPTISSEVVVSVLVVAVVGVLSPAALREASTSPTAVKTAIEIVAGVLKRKE